MTTKASNNKISLNLLLRSGALNWYRIFLSVRIHCCNTKSLIWNSLNFFHLLLFMGLSICMFYFSKYCLLILSLPDRSTCKHKFPLVTMKKYFNYKTVRDFLRSECFYSHEAFNDDLGSNVAELFHE